MATLKLSISAYILMINRLLIILILVTIIFSCDDSSKKERIIQNELESRIGDKLFLPFISDSLNSTKFKIVTFVNGDCPSCVNELDLWENILPEFSKNDSVTLLIYLYSSNFDYLKRTCKVLSDPSVIVLMDQKKTFYIRNNLPENKLFHTFLINKNDEILLVGNPIRSKQLENLYLKLLERDFKKGN